MQGVTLGRRFGSRNVVYAMSALPPAAILVFSTSSGDEALRGSSTSGQRLLSGAGRGDEKQDCMASACRRSSPMHSIVHRLDMETSWLTGVCARSGCTPRAELCFSRAARSTSAYVAIVDGAVQCVQQRDRFAVDLRLAKPPLQKVDHEVGKASSPATRCWHDAGTGTTRIELEPLTGRSHQLRVHMLSLGHAILGDMAHASEAVQQKASRLLLHAAYLSVPHPVSGQPISVSCPADF